MAKTLRKPVDKFERKARLADRPTTESDSRRQSARAWLNQAELGLDEDSFEVDEETQAA